jgi:hypothetical protein
MGVQRHSPAALPPRKTGVLFVRETGWHPGPFWTGAENLASTGIRSSELPARSQSLYRLSYRDPHEEESAKILTHFGACLSSIYLTPFFKKCYFYRKVHTYMHTTSQIILFMVYLKPLSVSGNLCE